MAQEENTQSPDERNLEAVHEGQGVAKKPRVLVVLESGAALNQLQKLYANQPESFGGCEVVFADTIDPATNAARVRNEQIDAVVTGLSVKGGLREKDDRLHTTGAMTGRTTKPKDQFYGLELAKALRVDKKPVVVIAEGEATQFAREERLTEMQSIIRNSGAAAVSNPGDLSVFTQLADSIANRNAKSM